MVEAKFLLELLMGLLTDPPGLDRSGEHLEGGVGRQVGDGAFLLSGRPSLANEPDLVARHALHAIVVHPVLVLSVNSSSTMARIARSG